jgi:hypothetical protein
LEDEAADALEKDASSPEALAALEDEALEALRTEARLRHNVKQAGHKKDTQSKS